MNRELYATILRDAFSAMSKDSGFEIEVYTKCGRTVIYAPDTEDLAGDFIWTHNGDYIPLSSVSFVRVVWM